MKRLLCLLTLVCSLFFSAALTQAAPVDLWDVSISAKFTDIVMTDGTRIADGGEYFSWDNDASFFALNSGGGQMSLNSNGEVYGAHFTGGLDRNMDAKQPLPVELKSLKLSYDIVLTPAGGAESVSFTLDLPVCYYNASPWGGNQEPFIFFTMDSDYASKQVVYDGMVYEFNMSWLGMYDYWFWDNAFEPEQAAAIRSYFGWGADEIFYGYSYAPGFNPIYLGGVVIGPQAVPVPAAVWLMGTGLAGLAALKRRKRG